METWEAIAARIQSDFSQEQLAEARQLHSNFTSKRLGIFKELGRLEQDLLDISPNQQNNVDMVIGLLLLYSTAQDTQLASIVLNFINDIQTSPVFFQTNIVDVVTWLVFLRNEGEE